MSQRIQDSMLASAREGRGIGGALTLHLTRTDSVLFLTKETS